MRHKIFFPGSFDPFTKGHESIVYKGLQLFDEITIGVSAIASKATLFSVDERVTMISEIFDTEKRVSVVGFNQLTVDHCIQNNFSLILRSIRSIEDVGYEMMMANVNRIIGKGIETIFLPAPLDQVHISSSLLKELIAGGMDVDKLVDLKIKKAVIAKND
jgi:pantetheine-phosphate adenylyltransferase